MKPIAAIAALLALSGCGYLSDRGRDFGDIWRLEASVGAGLQANVNAGEFAHLGVGSSRRWSGGWAYGLATSERRSEDHFPLAYAWSILEPEVQGLHFLRIGDEAPRPQHRCAVVCPGVLSGGSLRKPPMQYWNLEIGVMALVVGVDVGFNPAEFLDFLLGIFVIDLGDDDEPEGRARRALWVSSVQDRPPEP
jgi:hypothetical protein